MRQLQLKRFNIIFKNRATALANLQKYEDSYADGEIMAAAFYNSDSQTAENIAYVVGIYAKKDGKNKLFTIDVKDIEKQVEEVQYYIDHTLKYADGVELVTAPTYSDNTTDNYKVDMKNGDPKYFRLLFTPVSKDSEKVPISIGDIKAGTTAAELKKYTLSKLIDAMLFKTIYPTILNDPYVSISIPTESSEVEVGTSIDNVENFNLTYTQGQAQALTERMDLAATADTGSETSRSITYSFNGGSSTDFGSSLTLRDYGTYSFTGTVNYAQGNILHDSKGNSGNEVFASRGATSTTNRANPHPAGSVAATTSVTTYYKPGANSANINTIVKLDMKAYKGMTIEFKTKEIVDANGKVAEGGGYQIAVPHAIWNGSNGSIMKYNAVSGNYDANDTANWELTPNGQTLIDAVGNTYDCDLLKHKKGSTGNDGTGSARVAFQIN